MLVPAKDKILSPDPVRIDGKTYTDFVGISDIEIWQAFKSGSEIAFAYIYDQYFQTLYRYGSQFSRDRDFIKDSIQDLFMELLKKRQKLSDTTSIKYYLFKSLKINIISKLKTKKIDYRGEMDGFDFGLSLSIEDKIVNSQLDEEKKQRIGEAIKKLKKSQREVIYYFYFEDLDLPQIASLMHFSNPKSAQNLLYRSLGMLKKSLLVCWCLVLVHLILLVKL
jgi:RNA polymerase sigma factor (sigma-70 family)